MEKPLWQPSAERVAAANMTRFMGHVRERWGFAANDYAGLHRWSIDNPERFWTSVWEFSGVIGERGKRSLVDGDRMPGAQFFPDARLNFAENLLNGDGSGDAIVFWGEDKVRRRMGHAELRAQVAQLAAALKAEGVGAGDRVAGYVPNMPEAVIGMLATASLGAVWSSCSPDFGIKGVLDRFGQIEPKVLIMAEGYYYNGKAFDLLEKAREILAQLSSVRRTVVFPYARERAPLDGVPNAVAWGDYLKPHEGANLAFERVPFNAPLYIMYSSGTTGVPKCIVHGVGGTLLQHLKEHQLHTDVKPGDRAFYFTTCGWMMWNWLVSALGCGATLLLYDGSPFIDRGKVLWDFADAERITHF